MENVVVPVVQRIERRFPKAKTAFLPGSARIYQSKNRYDSSLPQLPLHDSPSKTAHVVSRRITPNTQRRREIIIMIFPPSTVLILGGGASTPYGFPLGIELKRTITSNTSTGNTNNITRANREQLLDAGYTESEIHEFHTALERSNHLTIDAFLEDRPSHRGLGAFAIAQALMPLESEDKLFGGTDWYPKLFNALNLKAADSPSHVSGIITFNYDRSLEHYLAETTRWRFEGNIKEAAFAKLNRIPVIHVHGALGFYPDLPYEPHNSIDDIKSGASGIKIIDDCDLDDAAEFKQARALIESASVVIFLGFGYDQRSIRRLDIPKNDSAPAVFGTARLDPQRTQEVSALFANRIKLDTQWCSVDAYLLRLQQTNQGLESRTRA